MKKDIDPTSYSRNFFDPFFTTTYFTNSEIEKIWKYQYSKGKEEIKEIKVTKVLEREDGMYILANKGEYSDEFYILKNPVTISVEDQIKDLKIFTLDQMKKILSFLKEKDYLIFLNGEIFDNKKLSYMQSNKIEAKYKGEDYNNFKKYILGNNGYLTKEKKILTLQKSSLSFYFDIISKSNQNESNFKLIIDENRINLFEKINKFYDSEFIFYLIMGTDGIGKTISFIYYSSCIYEYRVLYLNLKLYRLYNPKECEKIFFNELKRIFFINYNYPDIGFNKYQLLKNEILNCIYKNYSSFSELTGVAYFWVLFLTFLKVYTQFAIFPSDLMIILDQYKIQEIDKDFINLNNALEIVEKFYNFQYNKLKLIIIISINNKDTKLIFLENITNCSIDNLSNINKKYIPSKKTKENQDNNEFEEIENYLNKKIYELNNQYNKNLLYLETDYKISNCFLNSKFCKLTKKEYLNDIVKCYNLINEDLDSGFLNCVKAFNGSLKYYDLLLNVINKNQKKENESNDVYKKKILNHFYKTIYEKIKSNIEDSYKFSNDKNNEKLSEQLKNCILKLVEIREIINEEKAYDMSYLKKILNFCPIKYLDIHLAYSENMSLNNSEQFNFYIDYSNHFVKFAIKKMIDDFYSKKEDADGSEYGFEFEKKVNVLIPNIIHPKKTIKRYIWALVGSTKNSKSYVKKLREKQNCEFYEFYSIRNLNNICIDDIDEEEASINIKEVDVFLQQVSKTGRSFDSGLLIKKDIISNDKTHDLVLFQDTIYKILNVKKKDIYYEDSMISKNYLESLYQGLKIDKIYFMFILPEFYPNIEKTIRQLIKYQIYYIFYNLNETKFLDRNKTIIFDFRIKDSEITFSNINYQFIKALYDINNSKRIFNSSKEKFLKKNKSGKKFIDIYRKLSEFNFHDCIQVSIPIKLKKNIIDIFISENYFKEGTQINFLPSANYNELKIKELFHMTKNLILFSFNNNIFFFYYCYFKIDDDYNVEKIKEIDFGDYKNIISPKKNLKDFKEIKNYSLFLFCFNVLNNYQSDYE